MEIQFIGAAQTVTGSMHYLKVNGLQILFDCGMYQGKRKEAFELNRNFEYFDPAEINYVILSHAHIDHAGNLPNLVKKGFKGKILSTFATLDLCDVMLRDSAHIQEKDVEFVNKKRKKKGQNLFEPLYRMEDAVETMKYFEGVNYHHPYELEKNIEIEFFDAGHIMGSASTVLTVKEKDRIVKLGYSGDLGRPNLPILKDPEKIPNVDFLICEGTYGGRFHDNPLNTEDKLAEVINKAVLRSAKIIVPSFSVGRTQEIIYSLNRIFDSKKATRLPVFVDSPLSVNATEVYRSHPECFDNEISQFLVKSKDPFGFENLQYITEAEESKRLNEKSGPCMIISSSGMCEAGRILHHLLNNIEDSNNIVLIVGYNAEHTLGRRLVEKNPVVKIFGDEYKLNAEVIVMNSLSAHADANELINYCDKLDKSRIQKFFLAHGDSDQLGKFKTRLEEIDFKDVVIPGKGDVFVL